MATFPRRTLLALAALWPVRQAAAAPRAARASFEDSCRRLQALGQLQAGPLPRLPDKPPRYDDEELVGVSFFRTQLKGEDLANLSLPRTFFGKSDIRETSFHNTDLTESNLCWNDFTDVDFAQATLTRCDLRASLYERVSFAGADLRKADLRQSDFDTCNFVGADLAGAILTREAAAQMRLSRVQRAGLDLRPDDGEEPDGG